jgi:hypothetical protein
VMEAEILPYGCSRLNLHCKGRQRPNLAETLSRGTYKPSHKGDKFVNATHLLKLLLQENFKET